MKEQQQGENVVDALDNRSNRYLYTPKTMSEPNLSSNWNPTVLAASFEEFQSSMVARRVRA